MKKWLGRKLDGDRTPSSYFAQDGEERPTAFSDKTFSQLKRANLHRIVRLVDDALEVSDIIDEAHIGALLSHALALAEQRLEQTIDLDCNGD